MKKREFKIGDKIVFCPGLINNFRKISEHWVDIVLKLQEKNGGHLVVGEIVAGNPVVVVGNHEFTLVDQWLKQEEK